MRGGIAAALLSGALLVAAQPAGARSKAAPIGGSSMSVLATPHTPSAHPVRLLVTLRYEMQCNYPGAGPLVVTFPSAVKLPHRFAPNTVKLARKPIAAKVNGRRVTVTIPPPSGTLCSLRGPGSVTLTFTRAAKLANPARVGSYDFKATHDGHTFTAKLAIKAAG
jgi:hypothetical protein